MARRRARGSPYRWGPCSVLSWGAVEATAVRPVLASVARAPLPVVDCGSLRARWARVRGCGPGFWESSVRSPPGTQSSVVVEAVTVAPPA